jgi:hypothetical protein
MNKACSYVAAIHMLDEDACSVTLAEKKASSTGIVLLKISVCELIPGESQPISNASPFH